MDIVTYALCKKYTDQHATVLDASTTQSTVEKYLTDNADKFVSPEELAAYHDASKQDSISDLEIIRAGAAKGATAIQSLDGYATVEQLNAAKKQETDDVSAINEKLTKVELTANKVTTFENVTDTQYPSAKLVSDALDQKQAKLTDVDKQAIADLRAVPTKTSELTNDSGYLTSNDIKDLANKNEIPTKISQLTDDSGHITDVKVNGTSVVANSIASIDLASSIMGRDFTTNTTIGYLKSGTTISKDDTLADILYKILYKQPITNISFIFGGSLSIPTNLDHLDWKEELADQDIDTILAKGLSHAIKTGQVGGAELGEYPVMACTKGARLVQLTKMVAQGMESFPLDFEMVETDEYYIYYYPTKTYDNEGTTYIFTFEEV